MKKASVYITTGASPRLTRATNLAATAGRILRAVLLAHAVGGAAEVPRNFRNSAKVAESASTESGYAG